MSPIAITRCRRLLHLQLCPPSGVQFSFRNTMEESLPQRVAPWQASPMPRERQVLAYHKKYKTTSPLYETIRAKYPK